MRKSCRSRSDSVKHTQEAVAWFVFEFLHLGLADLSDKCLQQALLLTGARRFLQSLQGEHGDIHHHEFDAELKKRVELLVILQCENLKITLNSKFVRKAYIRSRESSVNVDDSQSGANRLVHQSSADKGLQGKVASHKHHSFLPSLDRFSESESDKEYDESILQILQESSVQHLVGVEWLHASNVEYKVLENLHASLSERPLRVKLHAIDAVLLVAKRGNQLRAIIGVLRNYFLVFALPVRSRIIIITQSRTGNTQVSS